MEVFAAFMCMYAIGMTVAFIVTLISRNNYRDKSAFLTKKIKSILEERNRPLENTETGAPKPSEVPAPSAVQPAPFEPAVPAAPAPVQPAPFTPAAPVAPAAPAAPQSAAPAPSYSAPAPRKVSAVGVSLAVGVLLLIISAAVFLTAQWYSMVPGAKCAVLAGVVTVVYTISAFCKHKLRLERTGSATFSLASLSAALAVFGVFLTFELQHHVVIMLLCCALTLLLTGFIGYRVYKSGIHAITGFLGFSWAVVFIFMQVMDKFAGFTLGLCTVSLIAGILSRFVFKKSRLFELYGEIMGYAAFPGLFLSLFIFDEFIVQSLIGFVFSGASLILLMFRRDIVKYFAPLLMEIYVVYAGSNMESHMNGLIMVLLSTAAMIAVFKLVGKDSFASRGAVMLGSFVVAVMAHEEPVLISKIAVFLPLVVAIVTLFLTKNKTENAVYRYVTAIASLVALTMFFEGALPYIYIGIFVAVLVFSFFTDDMHLPIAFAAALLIAMAGGDHDLKASIIMSAVTFVIYTGSVFLKKAKSISSGTDIGIRSAVYAAVFGSELLLLGNALNDSSSPAVIVALVINLLLFAVTFFEKDNFFSILPVICFSLALIVKIDDLEIPRIPVALVIVLVYTTAGRFICSNVVSSRRIDFLTIAALPMCFIGIESSDPGRIQFLPCLLIYVLSFIGRIAPEGATVEERIKSHLKVILSVAIFVTGQIFASFSSNLPEEIATEYELFWQIASALIVWLLIRIRPAGYWIFYAVVAEAMEVEIFTSLFRGALVPMTVITIGALTMFIISFVIRRRAWFIQSIVLLAQLGIMFSFVFWESRLWWVYLLIAGGVMIGTASVNEFKRRKAIESGMADKKIRLFDDWKW